MLTLFDLKHIYSIFIKLYLPIPPQLPPHLHSRRVWQVTQSRKGSG